MFWLCCKNSQTNLLSSLRQFGLNESSFRGLRAGLKKKLGADSNTHVKCFYPYLNKSSNSDLRVVRFLCTRYRKAAFGMKHIITRYSSKGYCS